MLNKEVASGTWEQQVKAINFANETTDKEIEGFQAQPETDLARIWGQVAVGTIPVEYELDQLGGESKRLASLIPKMTLHNSILQIRATKPVRKLWVAVSPQPLRSMVK